MKAYPVHESGGIVWAYMGPRETMTPVPRLRHRGPATRTSSSATKSITTCNWVQAMEGNLDTSHISHLHQFDGIDDIPDDGSDKPGYPSNAMSWKFWRHDRAPRLEVDDTWYGYRYAGIRTTPNGNTHVRVTAYVAALHHDGRAAFRSTGAGAVRPDRRRELLALHFVGPTRRRTRTATAARTCSRVAPFTDAVTGPGRTGILPRAYTAENDYQIDREVQRRRPRSAASRTS